MFCEYYSCDDYDDDDDNRTQNNDDYSTRIRDVKYKVITYYYHNNRLMHLYMNIY